MIKPWQTEQMIKLLVNLWYDHIRGYHDHSRCWICSYLVIIYPRDTPLYTTFLKKDHSHYRVVGHRST